MQAQPLSLIVATRGRAKPFQALFESLEAQTFKHFEVIVVDQNADGRVGTPGGEGWSFPIIHVRTPTESGASRARNTGFKYATGSLLLFPDDDCWYPPHFIADALARMEGHGADILSGRAADEKTGRDINGRYEPAMTRIDAGNVWTSGIEWVVFFKRAVFEQVGGYDPDIGVGAATPWQSCEAQDIMLRAIQAGYCCVFDPAIFGHHAELDVNAPAMLRKGRAYARGFGYVLKLHDYPISTAANFVLRPLARGALCLAKGNLAQAAYCWNVAMGRIEGWRMKVGTKITPRKAPAKLGVSSHA